MVGKYFLIWTFHSLSIILTTCLCQQNLCWDQQKSLSLCKIHIAQSIAQLHNSYCTIKNHSNENCTFSYFRHYSLQNKSKLDHFLSFQTFDIIMFQNFYRRNHIKHIAKHIKCSDKTSKTSDLVKILTWSFASMRRKDKN